MKQKRPTHSPFAPHDDIMPQLLEWQRNFILLHALHITGSYATGIFLTSGDGAAWQFSFNAGPEEWANPAHWYQILKNVDAARVITRPSWDKV